MVNSFLLSASRNSVAGPPQPNGGGMHLFASIDAVLSKRRSFFNVCSIIGDLIFGFILFVLSFIQEKSWVVGSVFRAQWSPHIVANHFVISHLLVWIDQMVYPMTIACILLQIAFVCSLVISPCTQKALHPCYNIARMESDARCLLNYSIVISPSRSACSAPNTVLLSQLSQW